MSAGPFSGRDVVKVIVDSGIYEWVRTNGDHAILRRESPEERDSDARAVPVPLHEEWGTGTLRDVAEQAGAKDFREFRDWIARNSREDGGRFLRSDDRRQ